MKTLSSLFLLAALAGLTVLSAPAAPLPGPVYAQSPDHPQTWVVGANNIHQDLRWDHARQMLVADVKYSTRDYADDTHPTQESDYTLAFPSVRLDPASGQLMSHGVAVGALRPGSLFTSNVELKKGLALDVHRHLGRITARIVPAPQED